MEPLPDPDPSSEPKPEPGPEPELVSHNAYTFCTVRPEASPGRQVATDAIPAAVLPR